MSGEEIMEDLKKVFTPDKFIITRNNENYFISTNTTTPQVQCLKLRFRPNNVEIDKLDKCGIQGSESIKMVEEALKTIPSIKEIKLTDASTISVCGQSIKMSCLKILSKGESWYNSLGYYSESGKWEKEVNAEIIAKPFNQFLNESLIEYNRYTKPKIDEEFSKLKTAIETNGSTWFPGTNLTDTTQEYFIKINAIILSDKDNNNCNEEKKTKYKWLAAFCNKILGNRRVLRYNETLFKTNKENTLTAGKNLRNTKKNKEIQEKKQRNIEKIHIETFSVIKNRE
jgi:hypothetical protein